MINKICSKCKQELDIESFSKNRAKSSGYNNQCKTCQKSYKDQHYRDNKSSYLDRNKENKTRRKIAFYEWMQDKFCVDCGNNDVRVLEFDHLDRSNKSFNISTKVADLSFESLMEEIEKCEIVCANCHKIRTANEFNWYSYAP